MARNEAKITLTAEDRASAAIRQVRAEVSRLEPAVGQIRGVAASLGLLAGGGVALSLAGVASAIRTMVGALDDLDEASQAAGVSAVALAELRQGAVQAGVGAEQLDTALTKLNSKLADAAAGNEQAAALFRALGVAVVDSTGKVRSTDAVLADVADRFAAYTDGANKSALAVDLFGKAGARLIPYLNQGADGLRVFSGLTEDTVREAAKLQSEFDKLAASSKRWGYELASVVVPALNRVIEAAPSLDYLKTLRSYITGGAGGAAREVFAEVARLRAAAALLENQRRVEDRGFVPGKGDAPAPPKPPQAPRATTARADDITDAQRALSQYVETLVRESQKLEQITEQERVLQLLRANPSIDTPQVRELLFGLAERVEAERQIKELKEAQAKYTNEQIAYEKSLRDEVLQLSGVAEQQRIEALLQQRDILIEQGALTVEQAGKATRGIFGLKEEIDKATDAADEFATVMQSAVSDYIVNGGSGSDFFKALVKDVEQLIVKLLILEPLARNIKTLLQQSGILDAIGGAIGGLFGGASSGGSSGLTTGDFTRADRAMGAGGGAAMAGISSGYSSGLLAAAGGGGGGVQMKVNIVNNAGARVSTAQRGDGAGGFTLDVLVEKVEDAIAGRVGSGRGSLGRSIESRYGLRQQPR